MSKGSGKLEKDWKEEFKEEFVEAFLESFRKSRIWIWYGIAFVVFIGLPFEAGLDAVIVILLCILVARSYDR